MTNETPKPCPVCGSDIVIEGDGEIRWVACSNHNEMCALTGPAKPTKADAIAAWNALYSLPDGVPQVPECLGCVTLTRSNAKWWCCGSKLAFGDLPLTPPTWCPKKGKPACKLCGGTGVVISQRLTISICPECKGGGEKKAKPAPKRLNDIGQEV